jgi:hypothetical protein
MNSVKGICLKLEWNKLNLTDEKILAEKPVKIEHPVFGNAQFIPHILLNPFRDKLFQTGIFIESKLITPKHPPCLKIILKPLSEICDAIRPMPSSIPWG